MSLAHLRELVNEMGGKLARKRADGQYISTSNAKRRKKMAVATRRVRCAMPPPACRNRMCTRRNSSCRRLSSLVVLFVRLAVLAWWRLWVLRLPTDSRCVLPLLGRGHEHGVHGRGRKRH